MRYPTLALLAVFSLTARGQSVQCNSDDVREWFAYRSVSFQSASYVVQIPTALATDDLERRLLAQGGFIERNNLWDEDVRRRRYEYVLMDLAMLSHYGPERIRAMQNSFLDDAPLLIRNSILYDHLKNYLEGRVDVNQSLPTLSAAYKNTANVFEIAAALDDIADKSAAPIDFVSDKVRNFFVRATNSEIANTANWAAAHGWLKKFFEGAGTLDKGFTGLEIAGAYKELLTSVFFYKIMSNEAASRRMDVLEASLKASDLWADPALRQALINAKTLLAADGEAASFDDYWNSMREQQADLLKGTVKLAELILSKKNVIALVARANSIFGAGISSSSILTGPFALGIMALSYEFMIFMDINQQFIDSEHAVCYATIGTRLCASAASICQLRFVAMYASLRSAECVLKMAETEPIFVSHDETIELWTTVRNSMSGRALFEYNLSCDKNELLYGAIDPAGGNTGQTFTFNVTYKSAMNRDPDRIEVVIDNVPHVMQSQSTNWQNGEAFTYSSAFAEGQHAYYFRAWANGQSLIPNPQSGAYQFTVSQSSEGWEAEIDPVNTKFTPAAPKSGTTIEANVDVDNEGIYTYQSLSVIVQLVDPDGQVEKSVSHTIFNFVPGQAVILPSQLKMPSSPKEGSWKVRSIIDPDRDSDFSNNSYSNSFFVGEDLGNEFFRSQGNAQLTNVGSSVEINGFEFDLTLANAGSNNEDPHVVIRDPSGDPEKIHIGKCEIYGALDALIACDAVGPDEDFALLRTAQAISDGPAFDNISIHAYQGQNGVLAYVDAPAGFTFSSQDDDYKLYSPTRRIDDWYDDVSKVGTFARVEVEFDIPDDATLGRTPAYFMMPYNGSSILDFTRVEFYITLPPPSASSLSKTTLSADDQVTISGNNFDDGGTVYFGTIAATCPSWNETSITCKVPQGVQNGVVTVVNGNGTSSGLYYTVHSATGEPETIQPIPGQILVADYTSSPLDLNNFFSDPNGGTLSFHLQSTAPNFSYDTALLISDGILVLTGLENLTGSVEVTVIAEDPTGKSVSATLQIIVPSKPLVETTPVNSTTKYASRGGGHVVSNGGSAIYSKGICWSTDNDPGIDDITSTVVSDTVTYFSTMGGLAPGTTYYYRAFATNIAGVGYGDVESFTTLEDLLANPHPGRNAFAETDATVKLLVRDYMIDQILVDSTFFVFASLTGFRSGAFSYDASTEILEFLPDDPFLVNEKVSVIVSGLTHAGLSVPDFIWSFYVRPKGGVGSLSLRPGTPSVNAVADFNRDGYPDITGNSGNFLQGWYVYIGDGIGGFATDASQIDCGRYVADFNRDGFMDVGKLHTCYSGGSNAINNGDGTFHTQPPGSKSHVDSVALNLLDPVTIDFNNDGLLDVLNGTAGVILRNADGALEESPLEEGWYEASWLESVTPGDFNNDGFIDVATNLYDSAVLRIYLNDRTGHFPARLDFPVPDTLTNRFVKPLTAIDLNGDGNLDLICTRHLFTGDGAGVFTWTPTAFDGHVVSVADVDGNGTSDLMGHGAIWLNRLPDEKLLVPRGTLDFGLVKPGTVSKKDISIINDGGFDSLYVSFSTAGSNRFSSALSDTVVAATDTLQLAIAFAPDASEKYIDTLHVRATNGQEFIVILHGAGDPILDVSPAPAFALTRGDTIRVLFSDVLDPGSFAEGIVFHSTAGGNIDLPVMYDATGKELSVIVPDLPDASWLDMIITRGVLDMEGDSILVGNVLQYAIGHGLGSGEFVRDGSVPMSGVSGLTTTDINGDGLSDIVAISTQHNTLSLYVNKGHFTFEKSQTWTPQLFNWKPEMVQAADFDNDGDIDLIVSSRDIRFLGFENQDGILSDYKFLVELGDYVFDVLDLDKDGWYDLSLNYNYQHKLINNHAFDFNRITPWQTILHEPLPAHYDRNTKGHIRPADINGDRIVDVITRTAMMMMDSSGSVKSLAPIPDLADAPFGVYPLDMDGGGSADLAIPVGDSILLFRNRRVSGELIVDTRPIRFEGCVLHEEMQRDVRVRNVGQSALIVQAAQHSVFGIDTAAVVLEADSIFSYSVSFIPADYGVFEDSIRFTSDDPGYPVMIIPVDVYCPRPLPTPEFVYPLEGSEVTYDEYERFQVVTTPDNLFDVDGNTLYRTIRIFIGETLVQTFDQPNNASLYMTRSALMGHRTYAISVSLRNHLTHSSETKISFLTPNSLLVHSVLEPANGYVMGSDSIEFKTSPYLVSIDPDGDILTRNVIILDEHNEVVLDTTLVNDVQFFVRREWLKPGSRYTLSSELHDGIDTTPIVSSSLYSSNTIPIPEIIYPADGNIVSYNAQNSFEIQTRPTDAEDNDGHLLHRQIEIYDGPLLVFSAAAANDHTISIAKSKLRPHTGYLMKVILSDGIESRSATTTFRTPNSIPAATIVYPGNGDTVEYEPGNFFQVLIEPDFPYDEDGDSLKKNCRVLHNGVEVYNVELSAESPVYLYKSEFEPHARYVLEASVTDGYETVRAQQIEFHTPNSLPAHRIVSPANGQVVAWNDDGEFVIETEPAAATDDDGDLLSRTIIIRDGNTVLKFTSSNEAPEIVRRNQLMPHTRYVIKSFITDDIATIEADSVEIFTPNTLPAFSIVFPANDTLPNEGGPFEIQTSPQGVLDDDGDLLFRELLIVGVDTLFMPNDEPWFIPADLDPSETYFLRGRLTDGIDTTDYVDAWFVTPALVTHVDKAFNGVRIYPNPFRKTFVIETVVPLELTLRDMRGRTLDHRHIQKTEDFSPEVGAGVYMLEVKTHVGVRITRMIKLDSN